MSAVLEIELPSNFIPRPYQLSILQALDGGIKRVIWVSHRRSGKDFTIFNWVIKRLHEEPCIAYYVMPTYAQAKKVIWDSMTIDGIRFLDFIPKQLIESKNSQEMKIKFKNGALLQLVGSDNIDSIMGTNPKIVVFSEYALQSPIAWDYIRPILRVNGGYAIFISTPRGKNHFYTMFNECKDSPYWYRQINTVDDTGILNANDLKQERDSGMSEELIQQEYYCSFDKGVEGAYYGKLISQAYLDGRVGNVAYEPRSQVHTAWDIGFGDSTAIVFWQQVGTEVRVIDYYENNGEQIAHYIKHIQSKEYVYGVHYFPHDAGSGSIHSGTTLQRLAHDLGLKTTVLKRDDLEVGIETTRAVLKNCYFDGTKCKTLVAALENYQKRYNDKTKSYSDTPMHNWASHAADAMRYACIAMREFGKGNGGLSQDKIAEMQKKHGRW